MADHDRGNVIEIGKVFNGLKIAISLSLLFSAILILNTLDQETFIKALNSVSPLIIIEIFILMMVNFFAAGLEFKIMVSLTGNSLTIREGIELYLAGSFISNVTPMATGGGPFQIYFLHKRGINIGQATMVILTKFILRLFFFTLSSLVFFIFFNRFISPGILPDSVFYIALGFGFIIAISLITFSIVPTVSEKIISLLFRVRKIRYFIKKNYKIKKLIVKGRRELREFHQSFDLLLKNKSKLVLAAMSIILYWSSLFLIIPVILRGLGYEPNFLRSYIMQTIFNLVIPYMPTPGSSGLAELGFASIFVSYIPRGIIGLVTFFWRFVTFYFILIIGSYFTLRELGWKRRKSND